MAGFDDHSYGAGPRVIRGNGQYAGQGARRGTASPREDLYDDRDAYAGPYGAPRMPPAPQPVAYAEPEWEPEYDYQPEYRNPAYAQPAQAPRAAAPHPRAAYHAAPPYAAQGYAQPSYAQPSYAPQPYPAAPRYDSAAAGPKSAPLPPFARMTQMAGAASSVAILIGVIFWGYGIAVRDVSGIPVIRAAEGPMRVAPADPGGQIADHVGMAVNALPAEKAAEALPEEIALAPAPVTLAPEDAAGLSVPMQPVETAQASLEAAPIEEPAPVTMAQPQEDAVALALEAALAEGDEVAVTEPVARSPRPMRRPDLAGQAPVADAAAVDTSALDAAAEQLAPAPDPMIPVVGGAPAVIDAATLPVGTPLVQLGAFDDTAQAEKEWQALTGRFGDLFSGKSMVVQTATSGGRMFYRLRAFGFADQDEQRRFCAVLLADSAACIPVTHR